MKKYRIKIVGDQYWPQYKRFFFFWSYYWYYDREADNSDIYASGQCIKSFNTEQEARDFISKRKNNIIDVKG